MVVFCKFTLCERYSSASGNLSWTIKGNIKSWTSKCLKSWRAIAIRQAVAKENFRQWFLTIQIKLSFILTPWYRLTTLVINFIFFWSATALMASRMVCLDSGGKAPFSLLNSSSQLSNCSITNVMGNENRLVHVTSYVDKVHSTFHPYYVTIAVNLLVKEMNRNRY